MTERPIIFSAPMVRAILEGRKTMTRRVLKPQPQSVDGSGRWYAMPGGGESLNCHRLPYTPGDLLWVREAWRTEARFDKMPMKDEPTGALVSYEADYDREPNDGCRGRLRPSIHMPRWASRLTLRVTGVKVERLHDITEEDAKAEAAEAVGYIDEYDVGDRSYVVGFAGLWASIHGPLAWAANPWVAAITFKRVK
jgi:hypothetical protein